MLRKRIVKINDILLKLRKNDKLYIIDLPFCLIFGKLPLVKVRITYTIRQAQGHSSNTNRNYLTLSG